MIGGGLELDPTIAEDLNSSSLRGAGFATQIGDAQSSVVTLGCVLGSLQDTNADAAGSSISVHCAWYLRIWRSCGRGLGRLSTVFLSPSTHRARGGAVGALDRIVLRWGKSEPRRARGPWQPLGHCRFRRNRIFERVSAGIHRSQRVVDDRR